MVTPNSYRSAVAVPSQGRCDCGMYYCDVIMGTMASQVTSLTIVYSTVYSYADQRKHQSSASLAFVRGIHRGPLNSPHKWPVTRKMFPFDDVIMAWKSWPQHARIRCLHSSTQCWGCSLCQFLWYGQYHVQLNSLIAFICRRVAVCKGLKISLVPSEYNHAPMP